MAKQPHLTVLSVAITLLAAAAASATTASLNLVPMPREIVLRDGATSLSREWVVAFQQMDEGDSYAAELLAREARECFGWNWKVDPVPAGKDAPAPAPESNRVFLGSLQTVGMPELFLRQGYRLTVLPGRVDIAAPTAVGRFYGVQTLRQLMRTSRGGELPCLEISDYPAMEWRGVSDDISRGQVSTIEDFRKTIRQLAYYKKNLYQPYIEDMFSFDTNPNIGRGRGAVTKAEMAMMVEEGRRNHVVVSPVFETLGHQDRLLSLPENRRYAEHRDTGKPPWSFSPVLPESLAFVKRLVDELAEATPSPFFHIGGDESWDVGEGTSKDLVKKIGVGMVHARFYGALVDYIRERWQRRTLLYGDMILNHADALAALPKDAIIVDWHYQPESKFPSVRKLKDAGFKDILVSPGIWSWSTFYPHYWKGFANMANFIEVGKREGVFGCITSSWGDWGAENLRENNMTGFAYSAAATWEPGIPDIDGFLRRYVAVQYGADSPELAAAEKTLGWQELAGVGTHMAFYHRSVKVQPREAKWIDRMTTLVADMKQARAAIATARGQVRFEKDHLASLDHAAKRFLYAAQREILLGSIAAELKDKPFGELPGQKRAAMQRDLTRLRDDSTNISAEFERLWMRNNKYPMLQDNISRLQKQTSGLQDLIVKAQAGEIALAPPPPDVVFWYPDKGLDVSTTATTGTKYFVRALILDKDVQFAELKCWIDDRGAVKVNGAQVAEPRFSMPAASANVGHLLKRGVNHIAIEGLNRYGGAGVLFALEIRFVDGTTQTVTGDDQWRTTDKATGKWATTTPKGAAWQPVRILPPAPDSTLITVDW